MSLLTNAATQDRKHGKNPTPYPVITFLERNGK